MSGEWLSRNNPRKRSSYDSDWGTYEARAGAGGGRQSWRGGGGGGGAFDRNNIIAEGRVVGVPHNNNNDHNASNNFSSRQQQQQQQQYSRQQDARGRSVRVADYRGAAARVGKLPVNDQHNPYSKGGGGGVFNHNNNDINNTSKNSDNDVSLFQNEDFLKSLLNPPPITVQLPSNLRTTLNDEQCRVVESILSGHSTFFTGPAGSGKSHVLSTLLKANSEGIGGQNNSQPRNIVVTATTGVAACNVGGITIHSFGGVGAGNGTMAEMAKRVLGNEYTKQRWREVDVLVIDEVSMMAGSFLDKLSFIASRARNDRRPFGGVQLVVCGDFFQLPPVELSKDGFAFEAKCWAEVIKCSVLLTQVFRQRGDQTLLNILDEARVGELSAKSAEVLRRHSVLPAAAFANSRRGSDEKEKVKPTLLECRNREVDKANEREMDKLPGETHSFKARDRGLTDTYKAQLKHCQAPATLDLKVGAQVMLLKNIDLEKGLANGSRGVVVRFQRPHSESDIPTGFKKLEFPVVRFDSIRAVGKDSSFSEGGDNGSDDDDNEFVIHPEEWTNKMGDQTVSCRVQIPLRLAWSISVHKSQGMTIPNLTVNLAGVFEYGQAYVALSRATELQLLTLRGFSEKAFRAHPKVKEFYRLLNGGTPNVQKHGKENLKNSHDDGFGDMVDPFLAPNPTQNHGRGRGNGNGSAPANPYSNHQLQPAPSSSYPSNPYTRQQQQQQYQQRPSQPPQRTQQQFQRVSPIPQQRTQHAYPTPPSASSSASPTLTAEQRHRIEENRKRALAIRMKKQQNS